MFSRLAPPTARIKYLAFALLACALLLGLGAARANAAHVYVKSGTFNGEKTPSGAFGYLSPASLAVNETTGEVYEVDIQHKAIYVFGGDGKYKEPNGEITGAETPDGSFEFNEPSSIAIDNSGGVNNGYLYVADLGHNVVDIFDPSGKYVDQLKGTATPSGAIMGPTGVTVDGSGDLYVSDVGNRLILKFTPTGGPPDDSDFVSPPISSVNLTNPGSLGADAAGNLYVPNFHQNFVKFDSGGAYVGVVGGSGLAREVEVNQVTGEVFFDIFGTVLVTNSANLTLDSIPVSAGASYGVAVNAQTNRVYVSNSELGYTEIFDAIDVAKAFTEDATNVQRTSATLNGTVNTDGAGPATCEFEWGLTSSYGQTAACVPGGPFTDTLDHSVGASIAGLTAEKTYHYRLKATNSEGDNHGVDRTFATRAVVGIKTDAASSVAAHTATLNGSFEAAGEDTTYYFEYGLTDSYGQTSPAPPGTFVPGSTPAVHHASSAISALKEATTYHYRIVAQNSFGTSYGTDRQLTTIPDPPQITQFATDVHSDSGLLHATIRPGGGLTTYHFEWGPSDCSLNSCTKVPDPDGALLDEVTTENVSLFIGDLQPGTTYHYRTIAENSSGITEAPDRTFTTFPFTEVIDDPCPNAHVRQQTGAALLLDCRAYELVSATDTGGYNVESDLVPGQRPFGGYPDATAPARVLYSVHEGRIPGAGLPTNHGPDPYVATRGENGWSTAYVGIPSDGAPSTSPFGSPVAGADAGLGVFAFGGAGICSPCYDDGSTNMPVRMSSGALVEGMAGSLDPGPAEPAGQVNKHFSADGTHFVFGSTAKFEADGNGDGDVTIYDRELAAGITRVVSKLPNGSTMTGPGIAELDISDDGSRIVVGKLISVDAAGNRYWHPYMHVAGSAATVDLAPGTVSGVIYNGMTPDGTQAIISSPDDLTADDQDTSIDIFRVEPGAASAVLTRISTGVGGATGNTDACDPTANSANPSWNSVDDASDCSAVPVGGGGGIADDGSVYFFSPELLAGASDGVQDAPNLFLARPGSAPQYATTLESSLDGPPFTYGHVLRRTLGPIPDPASVAIDDSSGDVYVLDKGTSSIRRYDSSGDPANFSGSAPYVAGNRLTGSPNGNFVFASFTQKAQVAVDSSGGPTDGYIYVTDSRNEAGTENEDVVDVFDSTGIYKGVIPFFGSFGGICGVTVDSDGHVYAAASAGGIKKYTPVDGNPAHNVDNGTAGGFGTCGLSADGGGNVYAAIWFSGQIYKFGESTFASGENGVSFASGNAVSVDPANEDVYVAAGNHVTQFDPSGKQLSDFGGGQLTNSAAVAVDTDGEVFAASPGSQEIAIFGPFHALPDPQTDNPAVVNAVSDAETHHYGDFQVSPSADHAVFPSSLPLTGFDTLRHIEVYRYDALTDEVDCASCAPTGVQAAGDAALAANGLSLSDDGRVFFNSTDELAPRDLNKKQDAYEWSDGRIELVSTGSGSFDSSLLSISSDGTDAYFYTREPLVKGDDNGSLVRIYDARSGGGFPSLPDRVPCQASDECHGPGTEQADPPAIGTFKGTLGNVPKRVCPRKKVRRNGRCVRKKSGRKTHRAGRTKSHGGNGR